MKNKLQYHSSVSFERLDNQAFYLNDPSRREKFVLVYDTTNTTRFTWESEGVYDVGKNTRTGLKFSLLSYGGFEYLKEPWHAPHSLLSAFVRQTLNENLMLTGEIYYLGGMKAQNPETLETEKLKGLVDLSLKGEYLFKKRYSAYLSVHNILNNKNQRFLYYPTQGFRVMVGATATF